MQTKIVETFSWIVLITFFSVFNFEVLVLKNWHFSKENILLKTLLKEEEYRTHRYVDGWLTVVPNDPLNPLPDEEFINGFFRGRKRFLEFLSRAGNEAASSPHPFPGHTTPRHPLRESFLSLSSIWGKKKEEVDVVEGQRLYLAHQRQQLKNRIFCQTTLTSPFADFSTHAENVSCWRFVSLHYSESVRWQI